MYFIVDLFIDSKGNNLFDNAYIKEAGQRKYLSQIYPTYNWVNDDGYENMGN